MSEIGTYRDLAGWQKRAALVTDVCYESRRVPREEVYGLTSQTRRSVISVPGNIAEGHGRTTRKDDVQFVDMALESLSELQTQLEIARNLNSLRTCTDESLRQRCRELVRMLPGLGRKLRAGQSSSD